MHQDMAEDESRSLEFTSTWIVAAVCSIIVLVSFAAERGLHRLGKLLLHKSQDALFEALQKLKEELMLLGFISLLLTVTQGPITKICIPDAAASHMLPCKMPTSHVSESYHRRYPPQTVNGIGKRLLLESSTGQHCAQGKVPLLSLEALHHLHIFIFVLAVVHVIFCCTTMVLGGAKIRQWKKWEDSIRNEPISRRNESVPELAERKETLHWRKSAIVSWMMSFFKQFYGSVTKSDYITLREGFIAAHCTSNPKFDFHNYMMRTLEVDFKKVVGISWYLWLFVVFFLLLDVEGWHTYFWLAFLPLILLLLVGAKLEHIITRLAQEVDEEKAKGHEARVKPSDEHFWFRRPSIVLYLIHFILFQNSFEIAFFFWIWSTYGFNSCIMEKLGYIIPRLLMGALVQVLCSYSTLPLYVIVTQMGSMFKEGMFHQHVHQSILGWAHGHSNE